ncbi:hypothetical protein CI088_10085 [Enterococcus plantarum]|uniref:Uncharacterized protein n=1 Tax=Enterococcus plantarum TaxID=1077675 RepID=A0A2W3ZF36_9ENTE|nr:hypothetical protein [Enterococcus plantarum]PZL72644.1 hypothetical protein CI088_10085 [Enterococcus plantarum]
MDVTSKMQLEAIQQEQSILKQEIKMFQQQQEAFFQLQKQEDRLYTELIDTSAPEERIFFRNKGEDNRYLAKKAQNQLREQEKQLEQRKKELTTQELEAERMYREAQRIEKEE